MACNSRTPPPTHVHTHTHTHTHTHMYTHAHTHTNTQLPELSCLTPSSAVKVPALCTSWVTLTWQDVVSRWLSSDDHVKHHAATLTTLFNEHLPKILDFLSPTLWGSEGMRGVGGGGEEGSVTSVDGGLSLEAQELKLSAVHVTITCCNILQVQDMKSACL